MGHSVNSEAESRFGKWLEEKRSKIESSKNNATKTKNELTRKRHEEEVAAKEANAKKVAEKLAALQPKAKDEEAAPETEVEAGAE